MRIHRPQLHRPRYADVAATLALLLATSGTAYAVTALPAHSVGPKQLRKAAVTRSKVAAHAVSARKLRAGAVTTLVLHDLAVTSGKLSDGAVGTGKIADGAVTAGKLAPGAVAAGSLAAGAVGGAQLAGGAVDSSKVVDDSLTLADVAGTDVTGAITFSLAANICSAVNLSVAGAQVGQVAYFSTIGNVAVPTALVAGPMKVTAPNQVTGSLCNLSGSAMTVSGLGIRIITLG
jgi:hypothetical protein